MGPNGSGKSTLANVLSGKNGYDISGSLNLMDKIYKKSLLKERARKEYF